MIVIKSMDIELPWTICRKTWIGWAGNSRKRAKNKKLQADLDNKSNQSFQLGGKAWAILKVWMSFAAWNSWRNKVSPWKINDNLEAKVK